MRSYPRNSPEAAARIVALILISDGHVCRSEVEAWNELDATCKFGLTSRDFPGIVQDLCEDLLMDGFHGGSILAHMDDGLFAPLISEVDKPELQAKVLRVAAAAADADKHLSDGEASVLGAISRHWGTGPLMAAGAAAAAGHE